jgi:hypothetical protein
MSALSVATARKIRVLKSAMQNYKVANGVTIYLGGFTALANVSFVPYTAKRGYAIPWENTANIEWLGLAVGSPFNLTIVNTVIGDTSAEPPPEVSVETGEFILLQHAVTGVGAQSDVGRAVYATNDNDLTVTANNTTRMGEVEYWHSSTSCNVRVYGRNVWLAI